MQTHRYPRSSSLTFDRVSVEGISGLSNQFDFGEETRQKKSAGGTQSTFISKLFQLLEDPSSRPLVEWAETGDRFTVLDTAEFSRQVLPLYFKHNNFQSFVRQLNMYGFHKAGASTDVWEFSHPNFRRGLPEEMLLIKRKAKPSSQSSSSSGTSSPFSPNLAHGGTNSVTSFQALPVVTANPRKSFAGSPVIGGMAVPGGLSQVARSPAVGKVITAKQGGVNVPANVSMKTGIFGPVSEFVDVNPSECSSPLHAHVGNSGRVPAHSSIGGNETRRRGVPGNHISVAKPIDSITVPIHGATMKPDPPPPTSAQRVYAGSERTKSHDISTSLELPSASTQGRVADVQAIPADVFKIHHISNAPTESSQAPSPVNLRANTPAFFVEGNKISSSPTFGVPVATDPATFLAHLKATLAFDIERQIDAKYGGHLATLAADNADLRNQITSLRSELFSYRCRQDERDQLREESYSTLWERQSTHHKVVTRMVEEIQSCRNDMNAFLVQPTGGHQPSQSPTPTTVHLSPRLSEDATGSAYSSPPGEQDPMGISSTEGMSQFFDFGLSSTREDQSPKADFRQITGADGVTQTARSEMTLMSETFGSSDSGLAEVHITHGKKLPPLPGSISSRSLGSADYSPSRKRRAEELGTAAELRPGKISRSITGLRG